MIKYIKNIFSWGGIFKHAEQSTIPSNQYMERVDMIDNVVRECMHVSQRYAGISSPSTKHFYASALFTLLCSRAATLAIITPHTPWAQKIIEHWDYASIASLTRTILEIRLAFFYLCVEDCSEEEWECRWNVLNLHDCRSRRRLFEDMQSNHDDIRGFEQQATELQTRLERNTFFMSLPDKQKKKYLKGESAYILPLEEISDKAGIDRKTFRWMNRFFSNHVHALPVSFYRMMDGERGRGIHSQTEEIYISMCLSLTGSLLTASRDELHELFKGLKKE